MIHKPDGTTVTVTATTTTAAKPARTVVQFTPSGEPSVEEEEECGMNCPLPEEIFDGRPILLNIG